MAVFILRIRDNYSHKYKSLIILEQPHLFIELEDRMSESDDEPTFHPSTLAALNEFYQEREERQNKFKIAVEQSENKDHEVDFEEDWVSKEIRVLF